MRPPSRTALSSSAVQAASPSSAIQAARLPGAGARNAVSSSKKGGFDTAQSNGGRSRTRKPAATSPVRIVVRSATPLSTAFSTARAAASVSRSSPVNVTPGRRAAICISTAPAPQPASNTRSPERAGTAAASRAASMPAR